jgi:hypothetical protein
MKKFFTLIFALMGFAVAANASTVDDIKVCKHSYVFDCAAYAEVGRTKGSLFADDYFLDVTGGSVGTKGLVNAFEKLGDAYADYNTTPTKSLRLKNAQDVIAMRITAGSKLIILGESHASRSPEINNQADMKGTSLDYYLANTKDTEGKFEWTAPDDMLIYIGSHGGDYYFSWIIVEANEAPGTPQVKVGNQEFVNGLWYKEVTVKPALAYGMETEVYYTTDGTAPTAESTKYTEPIKCYAPTALKFQAFVMGSPVPDAENEVSVNFSFDAPTITADGAAVTITSPYEGAKNFYAVNGGEAVEGSSFTLEESAKVSAYSQIVNGTYATFTSLPTSKEVYVLNPIKVKQTLTVTGDIVENPDKKAETDPNYIVENGAITHDKKFFYVRNDSYKVVEEAEYQVPAGQQAYLMMSGDNITFEVAEGDSVDVVVTCSKNSCKNINLTDEEVDAEGSKVANDRKCFINVDGTNYSAVDAEGNEAADLKRNPDANIVKFGLKAGIHTFKKYSGTGNILVSSIEITPVEATGIQNVKNAAEAQDGAIYNLAGQKVDAAFKGLVIKNGKKMIQK